MSTIPVPARRVVGLVLSAALLTYCAQQLLTPVFAPLSRELGLDEVELGLVISLAAATLMLTSSWWGRQVDLIGHRGVLLRGLALASTGLTGFAVVSGVAVHADLPHGVLLTAVLLTRSVLFGAGLAAVPVAVLAYVSSVSEGVVERTRLVGMVGAMQGGSLVLGPAVGGALAALELLLPVYVAPVVLVGLMVVLAACLPAAPAPDAHRAPAPSTLRITDPRILPYLVVGFFLFLGLGLIQVILGFVYQDRLDLDAEETAGVVGLASFLIGVALVLMQAVAVPALRWAPTRLMRVGAAFAVIGHLCTATADSFWVLTGAMVVLAVGLGLAMPGYNAGATLAVGREDEARVAGMLTAMTGLTFLLGPLAGTALYSLDDRLPMFVAAGMSLLALGLAVGRRPLRQVLTD